MLGFVFNFPHFMGSYRLLYRSREQVLRHKWASTYIPAILAVMIVLALLTPNRDVVPPEIANGAILEMLTVLAAGLLAWHYTGQAWGMTASFAFIGGIRMEPIERWCIRSGYYALLVFHLAWASLIFVQDPKLIFFSSALVKQFDFIVLFYNVSASAALLMIPLGMIGFGRIWIRTGKMPPWRSMAPWLAIYLWYALIHSYPKLFACLQFFHALQYIIFPIRVEINRHMEIHAKPQSQVQRGLLIYMGFFAAGLLLFSFPPVATVLGDTDRVFEGLLAAFVGIHHYFIDGAIWKIRNPAVRKQLFSHLG